MVPPSEKNLKPGPGEVREAHFDEGKPEGPDKWREKLDDRKKKLKYLETGERYWYAEEGFGSERRRTKA